MPTTHDRRRSSPYHKDHFTYCPQTDTYLCPQQKVLTYTDRSTHSNGYRVRRYRANGQDCRACPAFGTCTSSQSGRTIKISEHEPILQRHRQLLATVLAKQLFRRRSTIVEPVFGLLKEWHSARRFLLRGRSQVASEWHLLATAFNLKSLHAVWRSGISPHPPRGRVCHFRRFVHTTRHLTASITQTTVPRTKIMRQPPGVRGAIFTVLAQFLVSVRVTQGSPAGEGTRARGIECVRPGAAQTECTPISDEPLGNTLLYKPYFMNSGEDLRRNLPQPLDHIGTIGVGVTRRDGNIHGAGHDRFRAWAEAGGVVLGERADRRTVVLERLDIVHRLAAVNVPRRDTFRAERLHKLCRVGRIVHEQAERYTGDAIWIGAGGEA